MPIAAKERVQRNGDAGGESGGHAVQVERDDLLVALGKVLGEEAVLAGAVAGPGYVDVHFLDAHFEDVAGLGLLDGDGAGEDVASGAAVGERDLVIDIADVVGDLGVGDAAGFEAIRRAAGGERLHNDSVSGVDGEDRLGLRPVVAPGDGGRGREQGSGLLRGGSGEKQRRCRRDDG